MEGSLDTCLICNTLQLLAYGLLTVTSIIILTHIFSTIYLRLQPHLKLTSDSYVIITGGCLGIGREMAIEIAKLYHCKIMILDCRQDLFSQIEAVLNQLGIFVFLLYKGSKCECYQCDLADDDNVNKFINEINKRNKPVDLFIYNAGIHIPKRALMTSQKQLMMQFKVNFLTPVKIMRETIALLENGHIAVIASVVALAHGGVDVSTYTSSKNALYSYVNSFRQQLKADNKNTTISMGCPYLIKTGMFDGFKTRLDFIFRQLQPKYVAKRLVKEFIMKKQICYVYQYEAILFRLVSFLPTGFLDWFSINMNVSNFSNIQNKYDNRVKNMKQNGCLN